MRRYRAGLFRRATGPKFLSTTYQPLAWQHQITLAVTPTSSTPNHNQRQRHERETLPGEPPPPSGPGTMVRVDGHQHKL